MKTKLAIVAMVLPFVPTLALAGGGSIGSGMNPDGSSSASAPDASEYDNAAQADANAAKTAAWNALPQQLDDLLKANHIDPATAQISPPKMSNQCERDGYSPGDGVLNVIPFFFYAFGGCDENIPEATYYVKTPTKVCKAAFFWHGRWSSALNSNTMLPIDCAENPNSTTASVAGASENIAPPSSPANDASQYSAELMTYAGTPAR